MSFSESHAVYSTFLQHESVFYGAQCTQHFDSMNRFSMKHSVLNILTA